ncbi:MAG: tRNA lysidine(34) synthetase TilS [Bacteroidota bacterium]
MQSTFKKFISQNKLIKAGERVLLAVSGGIDSVVMCDLFAQSGIQFAIVHCNFGLRGKESEDDEKFVKNLSVKYIVPFFCKKFEAKNVSEKNKISIQMAARDLRYAWFEKLLKEEKYSFIATAHHQDDNAETILLNWLRGSGIAGMTGIPVKNQKTIRPLLFASRSDIEQYAKKNKLMYREDSSNRSLDYTRNFLRHKVMPLLREINPSLAETAMTNAMRMDDAEKLYHHCIENYKSEIVQEKQNSLLISISLLKKSAAPHSVLFEIIKPYGFTFDETGRMIQSLEALSGKQFQTTTHRLIKDRTHLIVEPLKNKTEKLSYRIRENQKEIVEPLHLIFSKEKYNNQNLKTTPDKVYLDYDKIKFPLTLRKWKQGDVFVPYGMKGKKKLSDFFIDQKLSISEKENVWVLCSGEKIVWVVGMRMDDRFKVTAQTKKVLIIKLH